MEWQMKSFEQLTIAELYEILKIRCEVFVVEQNCAYQDCDGRDDKAFHLFGRQDGKVIAYLRIFDKGIVFEQSAIGRVLVDKAHRGNGLAGELMRTAIRFVEQKLGHKEIKIEAQAYLTEFYGGLGFVATSEVYLEDNIPHIEMLYKAKQS